jgi:hypothetical protein
LANSVVILYISILTASVSTIAIIDDDTQYVIVPYVMVRILCDIVSKFKSSSELLKLVKNLLHYICVVIKNYSIHHAHSHFSTLYFIGQIRVA